MPTTRRRFLGLSRDLALGLGAASLLTLPAACDDDDERATGELPGELPDDGRYNVVLFLVDDLGVSDCGGCGSAYYRTPAMDRMAREGLRFTQAYSPAPLCSATRAAILTGKYPHRLGITGAISCGDSCTPVTTPSVAGAAQSWQKVVTPSFLTQLPTGERTLAEYLRDDGYATAHIGKWHLGGAGFAPADQGYTHVVGGGADLFSAGSHFSPYGISGIAEGPPGEYLADRLTHESVAFINANRERPFLLSLWHYGVHTPLQAPEDLVAKYVLLADPSLAQQNPVYAAMVEAVDRSLATLLNQLDALRLSRRTLVILTSDNGGYMQVAHNQYLSRVTSNGPWRNGKASLYEGGIRVPFLVRGGAMIARGTVNDTPVSGIDILPTVLARNGIAPATPLDGVNLLPLLEGGTTPPARALFWHYPHYTPMRTGNDVPRDAHAHISLPTSVVREGDYKLVRTYGEGADFGAVDELYDLAMDPGETTDLAVVEPVRAAALGALLDANLAATGALIPRVNPRYRERLDGWRVVQGIDASMSQGFLRLQVTGAWPQLDSETVHFTEPCSLRVTLRSARACTLTLQWSVASGTPVFEAARQQALPVAASADWQDVVFTVPVTETQPVNALRLLAGTTGDQIDIDAIVALAQADPSRELARRDFNGVSGLRYGGSWFSATDTFVACGPGSLQVDMPGDAPSIMSPLVTLFGPLRLCLRMRSTGAGACALLWSTLPDFAAASPGSVAFDVPHDGAWHEHGMVVDERGDAAIQRMMLTLGHAQGVAEIDWIRVFDSQGALVALWEFCAGVPA